MAEARLTAALEAVDNISTTLEKIGGSVEDLGRSVESLSNNFESNVVSSGSMERAQESLSGAVNETDRAVDGLAMTMDMYGANTQVANRASESVGSTMDDLEGEVDSARRAFESLSVVQGMSTAVAATNAGAMTIAGNAIDEMGDDALKTAGQMGVLNTVMEELSLSGSALSINIGAFNVSLRNLAPLLPIAASMGSVVTMMGAFITSLGAATVALGAFTAAGALGFLEDMQAEFDGLTDSTETLQAVMGGIKDLFIEALEPLRSAENTQFFVTLIEGAADLTNRLAQAISQMRSTFMPLFSGISDIISGEFDNIANGIEDMMEMMNPVLLRFFEWFMSNLPDALRFMGRITQDLAGPVGNLGDSVLDLLTSIIETATQIFQGLAPALSVAVDIATALIDVFNKLSNGAMQAALFIGTLVFAANKFVGIADTIANVGISAANTMSQWVGSIRNAGGIVPRLNSALANQFEHLRALGQVLLGNMSVQEASGQLQKDLAEEYREQAEAIEKAETNLERLRNQYVETNIAMGTAAEAVEEGTEQIDDAADSMDSMNDSSFNAMQSTRNMSEAFDDVQAGGLDGVVEGMDGLDEASTNAAESVTEATGDIDVSEMATGDVDETLSGLGDGDVDMPSPDAEDAELMDSLKDTTEGVSETINDEMGDAADAVTDSTDQMDGAMQSSLGTFENFNDGFRDSSGQFSSFDDELQTVDSSLLDFSDSADEVGGAFAGSVDDLDNAQTQLLSFRDIDAGQAALTDFGGSLDEVDDSAIAAQQALGDFDNVTDALEAGALSAGPSEAALSLDEFDDSAEAVQGTFADFGSELGSTQADLGDFGGGLDNVGDSISTTQASFDDFGESVETFDVPQLPDDTFTAFDDSMENIEDRDLQESLGTISTEQFFDGADDEIPGFFDDMSDDMNAFSGEMNEAMRFDVPMDDVQMVQPFERADAAVENFDDDLLAMADSADDLDLSETMDPIDTTNLDKVKSKLGGLKDSAQSFGKRTSDAIRGVGDSIQGGMDIAKDGVTDGVNSITSNLGMMKRAGKEQAAVLKRSFVQAGGATGIMSSAVTKARNRLGALKTAAFNAAGSLKLMAQNAWASIKALVVQGAQAARSAMKNWFLAFSQGGVVAGFKAMAASAWGAVTGLAAAAAGAVATAASFIVGLIPATLSAGLALNTAFAGIPALLGALIAASAVVVGILGNMDGITSGLKGAFDGLKSAISQIGNALLNVGVPAWNLFIDILEMALAPFLAIWDGIMLIADAFGLAGGEGGGLMGILGGLMDGFSALMNIIGAMFDFIAPAFSFIGDLLYSAFIIPFQIAAGVIKTTIQILQGLVALAIEKIPFLSEIVGGLQQAFEMVKNAIAQIPAFMDTVASMIGGTIDAIVGGIQDALQPAVDFINGLIRQANKIPKVDIDTVSFDDLGGGGASEALSGAQTTTAEVRENVASDEEEPGDDVATEPDVNMSLEDSVENNVQVDADPEDQAQLSRITKDALEEANSFARRQQGGQ